MNRRDQTAACAIFAALVAAFAGAPCAVAQAVAFSDQTTAAGLDHTPVLEPDMNGIHMFNGGAVGDGWRTTITPISRSSPLKRLRVIP